MPKSLVIVESPAKAKTIKKYLGDDYVVASSYGHVRDLPSKDISIDVEKGYEPTYVISDDKKKVVAELKKLAKDVDEVILATDEDREGEAISWHLCEVLGLNPKTAKRVTYTEITKTAIQNAINNPRHINLDLVNAQQARRVLDRLVGYKISPILWRKVKPSLSAGRVQSVAVRLLVEREREIIGFEANSQFRITADLLVDDGKGNVSILKAELPKRFDTEKEANTFLEQCAKADFTISDVSKKPGKKSPAAPFTTSTLQQEASRKLGFSVSKTMTVAQRLYENGHITYMRTDSVNLSDLAMNTAASTIKEKYGDKYHKSRRYKGKSAGAQEAHEAIRPTEMNQEGLGDDYDQQRLYDLIWKRTVASQMADAEIERTTVSIDISTNGESLQAKGEVMIFDGFIKVYTEGTDDEKDEDAAGMLPPLSVGQQLGLKEMLATERFSRPPARYTEAALVKKLEELGIGRPSTYAPTISTIQKRGYVVRDSRDGVERQYRELKLAEANIKASTLTEITGTEKAKLFPTDIGMVVTDFLQEHFESIMDYHFTADVEKKFDDIAEGQKEWDKMIDGFYKPFEKTVEDTIETAERASGERELGKHPETGEIVIARLGRYGPMAQIGKQEEESDKKPRFAKLRPNQHIETITLEEALDLFKLPRVLGEMDGKPLKAAIGRFGPYLALDGLFASLPKDLDPYTVTYEEAVPVMKAKQEAEKNKYINVFEEAEIQVLNGRYGPYIKQGRTNYKIPKGMEAAELTLEDCQKIIAEAPAKKGRRGKKK